MCPYTSCIDCCIGHSNGTCADPDLVSNGGGSCNCMLFLDPAPTCPDAVLTFAPCTGVFSFLQLVQILHLHT